MTAETITGIIILSASGLIGAMWALLKAMVANRLDRIEAKQDMIQADIHSLDKRVLKLETEHANQICRFERVG